MAKAEPEITFAPEITTAGQLMAADIDQMIRIRIFDPLRQIEKVITAELRQVYHKGGTTSITYGELGEREVCVHHGHPVTRFPPADFSDWRELRYMEGDQA